MKRLIVDVPNLFFRVCSAHNGKYQDSTEDRAGLALHSCLVTMNKWYNTVKPDQILVVFEGNKNWRKSFTASPDSVTKTPYKGNRVRDPSMDHLYQVLNDFEQLAREHTSIVCLSAPELEGDDLIAGCAQRFSSEGDEVVILSGDKDFMQLLKLNNVILLNPDKGVPRECENPHYFIFEKCIRGDKGDNVRSAFPNVRSVRLKKAFENEYERVQLMNETWTFTNPDTLETITYSVGELFKENEILMNLEKQPEYVRDIINQTIETGITTHGKFSLFAFSKFLGQHGLKQIADSSQKFVNLLNCKPPVEDQKTKAAGILRF